MQKLTLSLCFIFLSISNICANELSEGYASFIKNDIKQAYQHFTAATLVPDTKAEAYLMLSLISTVDKEQAIAFNYFLDFYKNSPNPDPYITALFHHRCVFGYETLKSKAQLNWLLELNKRAGLNSTLRADLYEETAKYYETIYDFKKSRENLSKIGAVMDWQIVGDFENISASGFDKDYGPIHHPEPEAVFKNKINAEVKWFDLYKQIPGKWIDFTNNFYCINTLVFAQTFCNSPSDQVVYLRIGTSGSLKLWVNDQLLFKEEEERNNDMDTYIVPVKISKGNNRILLQVASSKIDQCNFMVRPTDKEGNLLPNISFSNKYTPYNKSAQQILAPEGSFAEEFLKKQIDEHPDKLANYIVLANALLSNDKIHDALEILLKAQKMAPNCSFILEQLSELYVRDKNRTSTSLTEEKLRSVDPDNPNVLNYIINIAFEAENYKDARQYIEKKEKLYGENKDLLYYKLKLASAENKTDDYAALINKSYAKYPDDYNFVYDKYQFEKESKQNQKGAVKVLKDFTKNYFNKGALKILSDEYIQSGQVNEGVEILKKLIENSPFNDDYYKQLGLLYLHSGNFAEAKPNLEECLKIAPYYGPYHGNYARVLEGMGKPTLAINEYKLNIAYRPYDYESIKKLRELQSKKDVFDYFPSKDYYKIFENSPSASDYPSDNFISLTEDRQVVLYENGGCELRQVLMFKALTLKGIDNLKEYRVPYNSNENYTIEKAEVLKKNGNRLQAEVKDNQIVYTSLEPGDAVFLIYKKSRTVSDQMSKQFYEKSLLNNWYPSLNIEYNLLIAKDIKFDYKIDHSDVKPEITDADEFKLYSWKKTLNKAIQLESYMPGMIDIGELLSISTIPDWNYISKWYFDISNTKTKTDVEVVETVNGLMKGKENLSQLQKARVIYNFIEQNIRYSSVPFRQNGVVPQKASDVLITRIGDCKDLAVLFTSMCKVVDIKAGIVLVLRRQNGTNWMNSPSFNFDHAIAKANLDGKEYYIELTSNYYPFAALGDSHINAVVLDVNNDSSNQVSPKLLNPKTRQPNNVFREAKVTFTGDNMANSVFTSCTGAMTANTRYYYRDLGKDEREKKFTQSITDAYSNTKLLSLNFNSSLNDCSDTLTFSYTFTSPKVFTKINGLSIVKLPLTGKLAPMDFLSLEERKYPVEAWEYSTCDTITEKLAIAFPENKKLAEVPKSVHYSCNQADYTLTFKVHGNELNVTRKMIYHINYVPVADYTAYRNFIESVVNSDTQQIGFK
jgi:predicted Zn-dependent protease